ncbi:condensation domain-containing protein [Pseudoalteromonas sp.]|uniref:condensation domain-containing protein n=1 Tax=unclassified Pseudoalteromonas TaxID=194690 RepID=UPI003F9E1E8E
MELDKIELEIAITEQLKQTLKLADETIPVAANLIEFGLHSLAIMQLVNAFQEEYQLSLNYVDFASAPRIIDWIALLSRAQKSDEQKPLTDGDMMSDVPSLSTFNLDTIKSQPELSECALSEMQYSFWAGQQSTALSAHLYVEFDGQNINPTVLNQAIQVLFKMHPMLGVVISNNGLQTIADVDPNYQIEVDDLRDFDSVEIAQFLHQKRIRLAHQKLAIEHGEVIYFSLTLLPEQAHRLHIDVNMIAADASSILLIYRELASIYKGEHTQLARCNQSYFGYLHQREHDSTLKQTIQNDQAWWQERLKDIAPPPKLPAIAEHFRSDTFACDSLHHTFSQQHKQTLTALANKHQVSLSNLMLAVFSITVGNWSSTNRFRLNLPVFKRQPYSDNINCLVGDFTDLVILNVELRDDEPFNLMLQRLADERQRVQQHSAYSGINVLRDLSKLHEDTQIAPIVYTCGLEHGEIIPESVTHTLGKPVWCVSQGPMVDLDVQVAEHNQGILINWDVRVAAFKEHVISEMFSAYLALLEALANSPQRAELPLTIQLPLTQRQKRQLHGDLYSHPPTMTKSLHSDFWQQAKHNPENIALCFAEHTISYAQLAANVTNVATNLTAKHVMAGDCLAIELSDSEAYITAILAILSLGASYVVVNGNVSNQWTESYKKNQCQYSVTNNQTVASNQFSDAELVQQPAFSEVNFTVQELLSESSLAYIVLDAEHKTALKVTHQGIVSSLFDLITAFSFDQTTRLLSLYNPFQKLVALDIFATFSSGGTLVLVEQLHKVTPSLWAQCIQQQRINTLHCSATQLSALLNNAKEKSLASLAYVLAGVEPVATQLWQQLQSHNPSVQLVAMASAKQAALYTSYSVCDEHKAKQTAFMTYGIPLPSIGCRVLSEQKQDCPDHVVGQLWVAGAAICTDDLSSVGESLATRYEQQGVIWHNTGNFAYYQQNGEIQRCGSASQLLDNQGYVIELQAIAALIVKLDAVLDASVQFVIDKGNKILIAGVVVENDTVQQHMIHKELAKTLPRQLLPSHYYLSTALPVNSNGHIDQQALLSDCLQEREAQQARSNSSALQQAVGYIFANTIGTDISSNNLDEDFFSCGGDSLLATHLVAAVNQYFKGCELTVVDVFIERTANNLANKISEKLPEIANDIAEVLLKILRKNNAYC